MKPARAPKSNPLETRLLLIDTQSNKLGDQRIVSLPSLLRANDLLIVNDAATLPASLHGHDEQHNPIELRLTGAPLPENEDEWQAVLLGAGDWTQRPKIDLHPHAHTRRRTRLAWPTRGAESNDTRSPPSPTIASASF
ncbi:MAG: S-adenosylmethionine:tRNA ribosyltransferase-isomerase [Polyangiaceae bacterium]